MFKKTLICVFFFFAAFNFYILSLEGYFSVFPPFKTLHEYQMFADLGIALYLLVYFIVRDMPPGKKRWQQAAILIATFTLFGSMAPLLYLILRGNKSPDGAIRSTQ